MHGSGVPLHGARCVIGGDRLAYCGVLEPECWSDPGIISKWCDARQLQDTLCLVDDDDSSNVRPLWSRSRTWSFRLEAAEDEQMNSVDSVDCGDAPI